MTEKRYPPVGKCIYCGAQRYSNDRKKLGSEHIIPLAANGDLVLPEASCQKCERVTQKIEERVFQHSAKSFRTMHNYKSRNRTPRTLTLNNVNGTGRAVQIPADIYPNTFALMLWPLPWLISGKGHNDSRMNTLWFDMDRRTRDRENLARIGIYSWEGKDIHNEMVFREFAKIGHSFLVAEIGLGNFKPMLLDYIIKGSEWNDNIEKYIGNIEMQETPTSEPYVISWNSQRIGDNMCAVVSARLFAKQMGPTFLIIAGSV